MPSQESRPHSRVRRRWLWAAGIVVALIVLGWFLVARLFSSPAPTAFYDPPSPLPSGPPGTVIRVEDVAAPNDGMSVQRLLYTSTDPDGKPIAVSAAMISPSADAPGQGRPVLAWAHGTTGIRPPSSTVDSTSCCSVAPRSSRKVRRSIP